jgi:hypothetical protein
MNELSVFDAAQIAADFTVESIKRTKAAGTDYRVGINFEAGLCDLYGKINKAKL